MNKRGLLAGCFILGTVLCACGGRGNVSEDDLQPTITSAVTQPAKPTETPLPTASPAPVAEYVIQSGDDAVEQRIVSLVGDEECPYITYYEKDDIVSAIVSEYAVEVLEDESLQGKESFYVVIFDRKKDELIFAEKRIADSGFRAAFIQFGETIFLPVISGNDYCGVEYYDMAVYRIENGVVSFGDIAREANAIRWWQDYMPVLTSNGGVELYARRTDTEDFTNELMKEIWLYYHNKVQTTKHEGEDYAIKFAYTWEYAHSFDITELDYSQEQRILTQSRVYAELADEIMKPAQCALSSKGEVLSAIAGGVIEEDGEQLVVCKQLGSSSCAGVEKVAAILYDEQGRMVDYELCVATEVSIDCKDNTIHVFARYNQQGFAEDLIDGFVSVDDGQICFR